MPQLTYHFAYYNFVRIHKTLRVVLAMEADIVKNLSNGRLDRRKKFLFIFHHLVKVTVFRR